MARQGSKLPYKVLGTKTSGYGLGVYKLPIQQYNFTFTLPSLAVLLWHTTVFG